MYICSDCSYFGVCEGIYNLSFACMSKNGTFLWAGDDILLVDETNVYSGDRRIEEVEEHNYNNNYDDRGDEYLIEEGEEEKEIREATFAFAEEICMEVNTLEHIQDEMNRNITAHYLRETGIILGDMSIVACIGAVIVGIAFLFVAHAYYARHQARWTRERVESLNDYKNYSVDEFSYTSTEDGALSYDMSVSTPIVKR